MVLASWGLLLLYSTVILSLTNKCPHTEHSQTSTFLPAMEFPSSFMVSSVFTNWTRNSTMIIDEIRNGNSYAIEATSRDGKEKWSILGDQFLHIINDTNCSVVNESVIFSLRPEIAESIAIPSDVASLSHLVKSILAKNLEGHLNGTRVVAGVEGVEWFACLNASDTNSVVEVEVVYAGEKSIKPPLLTLDNPVILSLAFTYYANASDNANITERISLDFSPFRQALDLNQHLEIAHGVLCNGLDQQSNMSITLPKNFEVIYSKMDSNSAVTSKLTYHKDSNMIAESVIDGWAHLLNQSSFLKEDYFVVHDITPGTQFVFSSSPSCSISQIPEGTKTISSKEFIPIDLFFPLNFSSLNFALYSNVSLSNMTVLEYRANYNSSAGNKVIEAVLHQSKLSSVSIYSEGALQSVINMAVRNTSMPYGDSLNLAALLRGCFNSSSNNMVSFVLNEVSMDKISKWREDVVSNTIANYLLLNATVNISPYRLSFAFIEDGDGKNKNARVILKVAERIEGSSEMTAYQVVQHLKKLSPEISFKISDSERWKMSGDGMVPYPPPPPVVPPSFNGYTSGSMLVMAIFMVMLGVAGGAGGVYLVLRRQRISTLAYQVFE